MATYYYKKYNIAYTPAYYYSPSSSSYTSAWRYSAFSGWFPRTKTFTEGSTGYQGTGTTYQFDTALVGGWEILTLSSSGGSGFVVLEHMGLGSWIGQNYTYSSSGPYDVYKVQTITSYTSSNSGGEESVGSYVEQLEAEDGTYPDNGVQSGYWYIKQGLTARTNSFVGQL